MSEPDESKLAKQPGLEMLMPARGPGQEKRRRHYVPLRMERVLLETESRREGKTLVLEVPAACRSCCLTEGSCADMRNNIGANEGKYTAVSIGETSTAACLDAEAAR